MDWPTKRHRYAIQSAPLAFVCTLILVVVATGLFEVTIPVPDATEASPTSSKTITTVIITFPTSTNSSSTSSNAMASGNQSVLYTSEDSPDGLQLEMVVNSTTMRVNGSISGDVAVVNTLATNVTVSVPGPSQNMSNWSDAINVCPSSDFLGYAVFNGHFAADNVSLAGPPLVLVPPMILSCPIPYHVPGPLTFLPGGDPSGQTVVYAQSPSNTVGDQLPITTLFCNTTVDTTESGAQVFGCSWASPGLVGYWEGDPASAGGNFGFTSPGFARLPPGVYTIMAWDVWDQYAFARVMVTGWVG
jgi:hypothetical protein